MTDVIVRLTPKDEDDAKTIRARLLELMITTIDLGSASNTSGAPILGITTHSGDIIIRFAFEIIDKLLAAIDPRELIAAAGRAVGKEKETSLTLIEKEQSLRKSVALPTTNDWQLLVKEEYVDELVDQLNAALIETLSEAKSGALNTWKEIETAVYGRMNTIEIITLEPASAIAKDEEP